MVSKKALYDLAAMSRVTMIATIVWIEYFSRKHVKGVVVRVALLENSGTFKRDLQRGP